MALSQRQAALAQIAAEKQEMDNSCWAACLAWYCRAYGHGLPPDLVQDVLVATYAAADLDADQGDNDEVGSLQPDMLESVYGGSPFNLRVDKTMTGSQLTESRLKRRIRRGPAILGFQRFYSSPAANHLVVAYGYDAGKVYFMDPGRYMGGDYTFVGAHCVENLSGFQASPNMFMAWK